LAFERFASIEVGPRLLLIMQLLLDSLCQEVRIIDRILTKPNLGLLFG